MSRLTFRRKTILGIAAIETVMLVALVWTAHIEHTASTNHQIAQRAETTAALFASLAKNPVLSTDLATLDTFVAEMLQIPGVVYVRVFGYERVLALAGELPAIDRIDDTEGQELSDKVFDVSRVIAEGGTVFGRIQLGISSRQAEEAVSKSTHHQLMIALLEVLAVGVFSMLLGTYLTRELDKLLAAVSDVTRGRLGTTIRPSGNDELTDVVNGFNTMSLRLKESQESLKVEASQSKRIAASLREREAALNAHKQNLEQIVADRTQDLLDLTEAQKDFIRHANAPIFSVDPQLHITTWNDKAEELTGYSRDEVLGRSWRDLFAVADGGELGIENLQTIRRTEREMHVETANDKLLLWVVGITPVLDPDGNLSGFAFVGYDTTERREIEAQMLQTSKLATLGEMATSVAHELNQPLVVISMAVENSRRKLELGRLSRKIAIEKFDTIREQIERASEIIKHMRIFGRRADEDSQLFYPVAGLKDAERMVREQMRLAEIDVVLSFEEAEGIAVNGNKMQFEQVIINLLTNARDAIDDAGEACRRIDISAKVVGQSLEIEVCDSGAGIPKEVMDRVFEPFFTTKTEGIGTGLGLSISYGIISDMGGQMTARNREVGAAFQVTIPIFPTEPKTSDLTH